MDEQLKILIIDNEPIVHFGFEYLLKFFRFNVIFLPKEIANSEKDVREMPDIIILGETFMSKSAGINKLKRLKVDFPSSRILIFSVFDEKTFAIPCFKAGAHGYLSKNASVSNIISALETLLEGRRFFCSAELKERLFNDLFDGKLTIRKRKLSLARKTTEVIKKIKRKSTNEK